MGSCGNCTAETDGDFCQPCDAMLSLMFGHCADQVKTSLKTLERPIRQLVVTAIYCTACGADAARADDVVHGQGCTAPKRERVTLRAAAAEEETTVTTVADLIGRARRG